MSRPDTFSAVKNYGCDYLVLVSESLTRLYKSGTRSSQLFYGKIDGDYDLDFSIKLTSDGLVKSKKVRGLEQCSYR